MSLGLHGMTLCGIQILAIAYTNSIAFINSDLSLAPIAMIHI